MNNFLASQTLELFAVTYAGAVSHPANSLLDKNGDHIGPERSHFMEVMVKAIGKA
jgi:hypothetical protein